MEVPHQDLISGKFHYILEQGYIGGRMPWETIFLIIFAGFVLLLDRDIDPYPSRFPESNKPGREIIVICLLWGIALFMNALRQLVLVPFLSSAVNQPDLRELIYLPILSLPFLFFPLYLSLKIDHYSPIELGLNWKSRSSGVVIFAISFGVISGAVAFWTGATVVGITSLSAGALLLLIYNNAFIEEFYYRGVIQNRLERIISQRWSVIVGGVIFASSHILLDYKVLANNGGLNSILFALSMQILGGWLLGLIFIKTRTLWPGVICHYLINWMPSILSLLAGT
jgi:membrane protease YdiL (CAAX protease family)